MIKALNYAKHLHTFPELQNRVWLGLSAGSLPYLRKLIRFAERSRLHRKEMLHGEFQPPLLYREFANQMHNLFLSLTQRGMCLCKKKKKTTFNTL